MRYENAKMKNKIKGFCFHEPVNFYDYVKFKTDFIWVGAQCDLLLGHKQVIIFGNRE